MMISAKEELSRKTVHLINWLKCFVNSARVLDLNQAKYSNMMVQAKVDRNGSETTVATTV